MKNKKVPDGWNLLKLGKLLTEVSERNKNNNNTPVLSVTNKTGFVISEDYFSKKVFSKDLSNYKVIRKGQFAYNPSRVNVGSIAHLKEFDKGLLSPMYVVFEAKKGLDAKYLDYWISSPCFRNLVKSGTQGTVRDSLNYSSLAGFPFLLPPISEQQKIFGILSSIDTVIDKTQAIIEQTQIFKKGLMQELFTRGIPGRHKKFKKTEIGQIPEDWKLVKLKDILREKIRNGYSPNCSEDETGHPILGLNAVTFDGFNCEGAKFAPSSDKKIFDFILQRGDLLVSRSNTPERVGLAGVYEGVPAKCSYPDLLMRVRVDENKVYPQWVEKCLLSGFCRKYFERIARGTSATMVKIDKKILEDFLLGVPSLSEQKEIIVFFENMKNVIQQNKILLDHLNNLKSALMQVLLTGEVRVKI